MTSVALILPLRLVFGNRRPRDIFSFRRLRGFPRESLGLALFGYLELAPAGLVVGFPIRLAKRL